MTWFVKGVSVIGHTLFTNCLIFLHTPPEFLAYSHCKMALRSETKEKRCEGEIIIFDNSTDYEQFTTIDVCTGRRYRKATG